MPYPENYINQKTSKSHIISL